MMVLSSIYDDEGDFVEEKADRIFENIEDMWDSLVSCLKFLHQRGIYHRDIKPENILIFRKNPNGGKYIAKFADFGLSCIYGSKSKHSLCPIEGKSFTGSPDFFDPAILDGDFPTRNKWTAEDYLQYADFWALAMAFFTVLKSVPYGSYQSYWASSMWNDGVKSSDGENQPYNAQDLMKYMVKTFNNTRVRGITMDEEFYSENEALEEINKFIKEKIEPALMLVPNKRRINGTTIKQLKNN